MTDHAAKPIIHSGSHTDARARRRLKARYRTEWSFKALGVSAIAVALGFLLFLFTTIFFQGIPAFTYNFAVLDLELNASTLGDQGEISQQSIAQANYDAIVRNAIRGQFPQVKGRSAKRALSGLMSSGAPILLREALLAQPELAAGGDVILPLSDFADLYLKGQITASVTREGHGPLNVELADDQVSLGGDFSSEIAAIANYIQTFGSDAVPTGGVELSRTLPSILVYADDGIVKLESIKANSATGQVLLPLAEDADIATANWTVRILQVPEADRKFSDLEIVWTDALVERNLIKTRFNTLFFTRGASREPEMAGIYGALVGTILTLIVTLGLGFPLGVAAAVYLEEFAPRNRWTRLIEVNINNLAAVPSIVFGLLGLAVFLNFFGMPRSAPVVGGMVLALMTLPTIIIASRAALRAVPPSIRQAALGIGASRLQVVVHHVLPLAMPGILTGTILGMAHALGETAPLLMIGMVAFVVDIPGGFSDPATVLPVQIFMWADFPEPAFLQRTSAAILVLLAFLVAMNALAVILRKQFERRW